MQSEEHVLMFVVYNIAAIFINNVIMLMRQVALFYGTIVIA
jgi:hypothetical protein